MSFSSLERSWGRGWNGHPVSIPCHIPCLRYINCSFWNIQSQLCWSSYLVRFKVMSILMGILSRIKPTIFDKWNNNPGCSLLFNLWQDSQWPCLLGKMCSENNSWKSKDPVCSGHSNWERGRQRQQNRRRRTQWLSQRVCPISQSGSLLLDTFIPTTIP